MKLAPEPLGSGQGFAGERQRERQRGQRRVRLALPRPRSQNGERGGDSRDQLKRATCKLIVQTN